MPATVSIADPVAYNRGMTGVAATSPSLGTWAPGIATRVTTCVTARVTVRVTVRVTALFRARSQ
jgi:hypothetical protein